MKEKSLHADQRQMPRGAASLAVQTLREVEAIGKSIERRSLKD